MAKALLDRGDRRSTVSPAQRLRETTAAVRVSFTWLGVRKTLTQEQKNRAAESFGAEGDYLSARKKLLDTNHPAYKVVTGVRGKVSAFWKSLTLPFPEPGIRLIRQHEVEGFDRQMADYRVELDAAVRQLDERYSELKSAACDRLGDLFNPNDYPASLHGLFGVDWDFPNLQPPDYLSELNPSIYEQERARVAARFEEAVKLTEQAFIGEFARLIEHLTERISSSGDGERKIFRDSAITNLTEFFNRFRQLNVSSSEELDALVEQAQRVVQGTNPQALRDNDGLRQHMAAQLSRVQAELDGMLVDRPRRKIVRNPEAQSLPHEGGV
jgi:hypothetical protein